MLDAGNALFRNQVATDADRKRAHVIFDLMGRLGTRAMAVGALDVSAGLEFLASEAKAAKVKVLSSNLKRDGKLVFDASTIIDVDGLKVAIVGVSPPGPMLVNTPSVLGDDTVPSVKKALSQLGKHDLTVLLAAVSYPDASQLSAEFKAEVDFVIRSGDFHGVQPPQRVGESNVYLFACAQRGQAMGKISYAPGAGRKAPLVDLSASQRDRQQLEFVNRQVATLEDRLKLVKDPTLTGDLKSTLAQLRERQAQLAKSADASVAKGARTLDFEWVMLGADKKDDPAIKAEVLVIEPTYAGSH